MCEFVQDVYDGLDPDLGHHYACEPLNRGVPYEQSLHCRDLGKEKTCCQCKTKETMMWYFADDSDRPFAADN